MKKGKMILGAAAFLVTAASTLAFKMHSRSIANGKRLYAATSAGSSICTLSTCRTLAGGPVNKSICHTLAGLETLFTLGGTGNGTLWTSRTIFQNRECLHPITKWTH